MARRFLGTKLDIDFRNAHASKIISSTPNAKLTHGSLEPAGGSTTGQGEGAEAAEAASVTEPVEL